MQFPVVQLICHEKIHRYNTLNIWIIYTIKPLVFRPIALIRSCEMSNRKWLNYVIDDI